MSSASVRLDHPVGHATYLMAIADYHHLALLDENEHPVKIIPSCGIINNLENYFQKIRARSHRRSWIS